MESFFPRKWKRWEACSSKLFFNSNDIGANVEEMQPTMTDKCKYPRNLCGEKFLINHFGFGFCVRNAAVVTSLVRNDFRYVMC